MHSGAEVLSATAITPKIGKPTAVMRKPMKAESDSVPACTPSQGGKIRLPAPKNIAKSVRPTKLRCLSVNACISEIPPPQEKALRLAHAIPRNALVSRDSLFNIPLITALCIMEISLFSASAVFQGALPHPVFIMTSLGPIFADDLASPYDFRSNQRCCRLGSGCA